MRRLAFPLFLAPFLAFGKPDCSNLPGVAQLHNPNCAVPMPEHWGSLESIGYSALVLAAFLVIVRFKLLQPTEKA
jgi:hypothetical protein